MAVDEQETLQSQSAANFFSLSSRLEPATLLSIPLITCFAANGLFALRLVLGASFFQVVRDAYSFNTVLLPVVMGMVGLVALVAVAGRCRSGARLWVGLFNVGVAALLIGLRGWCTYYEPHQSVLKKEIVPIAGIDAVLRIVHISDTQADRIGNCERDALSRVAGQDPAILIHTGDFLQPLGQATWQSEWPKLAQHLAAIPAPLGRFGVQGDVDIPLTPAMQSAAGITILNNAAAEVEWDGRTIRLYGLGAAESRRPPVEAVEAWLRGAQPDDITILLGHAPDFILSLDHLPIDLCLAGHTHGGQVRVPFFGPPVTLSRVPRELARGMHAVGQTRLNVSAGLGSEHLMGLPAIRFNCPTEFSVIEMRPDGSE